MKQRKPSALLALYSGRQMTNQTKCNNPEYVREQKPTIAKNRKRNKVKILQRLVKVSLR